MFLRALGLIYFSAFYSLLFQIKGLIGPAGILPTERYLQAVGKSFGAAGYWYAPTLLWIGSSRHALDTLVCAGLIASALLTLNVWPRGMLVACLLCFLSFIAAAQDFASYQSDGMLLEAGFICLFFSPPGLRPGLGRNQSPSRMSLFLLQWLWFRIYLESGLVKLASGEAQWRNLTAMDEYYQNGPLPTWIGWYVQKLPHGFHATTALATLMMELALVWMLFLPRRFRRICFWIITPWEMGVILTANYAFLNYLVLSLGILLLDDEYLAKLSPRRWREKLSPKEPAEEAQRGQPQSKAPSVISHCVSAFFLGWIFYATTAWLVWIVLPGSSIPSKPVSVLAPFRIANRYGLFAIMTRGRYEIEFQGSRNGSTWQSYPFRYKPQDPRDRPRIYAPYQPRFEWNLWFASLGGWRENPFVVVTEVRLLENAADVLALFRSNPFSTDPPHQVRAVIWQYWFTNLETNRSQGLWWRRELLGLYAPPLERRPDGTIAFVEKSDLAIAPPRE
ncbi:MAG TPA: lipase maturation factor family protein [Acidobacteriota bacterium]|jgi:hypothetical protein|nr:lipase maturation factor family protein [Acidobacteriota bacterium]